jgi:alpha-tubulin suppressor-like RCC1 family protein
MRTSTYSRSLGYLCTLAICSSCTPDRQFGPPIEQGGSAAEPGQSGVGESPASSDGDPTTSVSRLQPGNGNVAGLGECVEGETEACGPDSENGICRFGVRTCIAAFWGPCEGAVLPAARRCDSADDNDCDGQPDNTVDRVCTCLPSSIEPCGEHPGLDGRGPCRAGERSCVLRNDFASSTWSACQGAVGPAAADSCAVPGDDGNCDGRPNGACDCVDRDTVPCGPETDNGICQRGVSTCVGSAFSECQGAVFPQRRDCSSGQDNDCDGRPDNTVDSVCTCVVGDSQICGEHPGRDGNGSCQAGRATCVVGASNATSLFGACQGSVGPAGLDSCSVRGDDSNCDGTPNTGCECLAGDQSTCGAEQGSLGVCAARVLTCGNDGRWPAPASCAPSSQEVCTNTLDDDCDGQVNEAQACDACVDGCFCEDGSCAEMVDLDTLQSTTCALSEAGSVWCWGANNNGQVGVAGFTDERRPRRLEGMRGARDIAVGLDFSCAVQADQTVICWGNNSSGQLGDSGATTTSFLPVQVLTAPGAPLTGIVKIVAGDDYACALRGADGAVLCWGRLVIGANSTVAVPVGRSAATNLLGVGDLTAGGAVFARVGRRWLSWGSSTAGKLGQGIDAETSPFARDIADQPPAGFVSLAAGTSNACGLSESGVAFCWGGDALLAALGSGSDDVEAPVAFPLLDGNQQLALSSKVGFAVDATGAVRVFGTPGAIPFAGLREADVAAGALLPPTRIPQLNKVKLLATGLQSACALQADDTMQCWGSNRRGEVGNGSSEAFFFVPVQALPL